MSSFLEQQSIQGQTPRRSVSEISCCSLCLITAQNVDVYYWPEPDADTSCLSIVGSSVNPPLYGATHGIIQSAGIAAPSAITYWGCTVQDPISGPSYVTTARITSIGPVTFKKPLVDPWLAPPCVEEAPAYQSPSTSIEARRLHAAIYGRGHSLVLPPNITQNNGLPVSTVVMEGFTL